MPQPGLHAVVALATRKIFSREKGVALGLTFGALIPDADGYPQAYAIIISGLDPHTAEAIYHRTFSHSLFFALITAVVFYCLSLIRGHRELYLFGLGLAIGMAILHSVIDIFAWFDGVGILWPLWSINLWSWLILPEIISRLLRAGNFWAFSVYFAFLAWVARRAGTNADYLPRLDRYIHIQFILGLIFTVLAFILSTKTYNTADGAVFLFFAYPNALWITWQMRETIEAG